MQPKRWTHRRIDSVSVHMLGNVVTAVQKLGVGIQYANCQSVDVGFNNPFKAIFGA